MGFSCTEKHHQALEKVWSWHKNEKRNGLIGDKYFVGEPRSRDYEPEESIWLPVFRIEDHLKGICVQIGYIRITPDGRITNLPWELREVLVALGKL